MILNCTIGYWILIREREKERERIYINEWNASGKHRITRTSEFGLNYNKLLLLSH